MPRFSRRFPGLFRGIFRALPPPKHVRLADMITAYWASQMISVAADLKIPDHIEASEGRKARADELAARLGMPAEPLQRLLRALVNTRIATEEKDGSFGLTGYGRLLTSDRSGSMRAIAAIAGAEWYRAWGDLRHSLSTNECAFEKVYGEPFFEYAQKNPERRALFDEGMRGISSLTDVPIAIAYDFSKLRSLTDVGGGTGSQMLAILKMHPRLKGVVFDLPQVVEHAWKNLPDGIGLLRRLTFAAGDFLADAPPPSNGYLLKSVLHDWDDEHAVRILKKCSGQMKTDDRLLIAEHVIQPGNNRQFGKGLDLMMMVNLGGKERTREQYQSLLEKAGLAITGEYPTVAEMTVLEARVR